MLDPDYFGYHRNHSPTRPANPVRWHHSGRPFDRCRLVGYYQDRYYLFLKAHLKERAS